MKPTLADVDPLRLRMIGAIFWALLLVYLVPLWFQNPVVFSPDAPVAYPAPVIESVVQPTGAASEQVAQRDAPENEHSELFIDKPLTVVPPPADPQRVQALAQPLSVREVQVDGQGNKLVVSTKESRLAVATAPTTSADGHYWVQVATYQTESMANDTQSRIRSQGFVGKITASKNKRGHVIFVLRTGPYKTIQEAHKAKSIIDARLKTKSMVLKR